MHVWARTVEPSLQGLLGLGFEGFRGSGLSGFGEFRAQGSEFRV